jgi:hypothetical protein
MHLLPVCRFSALVLAPLLLSACATIIEGTSQSVVISTDPAGANCVVDRKGTRVGQVNPTPGSIHIDKSKDDLSVACTLAGYQSATVAETPKFQGTTFGNIVAGGLVGVVVDAASGANYAYPNDVRLTLAADRTAAPAPVVTAPAAKSVSFRQ